MLWKQYVVWHCNGYTAPPISNYINNQEFQELLLENDYFRNKLGEKNYIDLRNSMGYTDEIKKPSRNNTRLMVTIEMKFPLAKKIRLRVYMLRDGELMLNYKSYTIKALDDVIP